MAFLFYVLNTNQLLINILLFNTIHPPNYHIFLKVISSFMYNEIADWNKVF